MSFLIIQKVEPILNVLIIVGLIYIMIIMPIISFHESVNLANCAGTTIDKTWWMYIVAIVVWDIFVVVLYLVVALLLYIIDKIIGLFKN